VSAATVDCGVQFDNSFSVQAPLAAVYEAVSDIARVVPCVPGAKLVEQRGDDIFEVALKAQLGPMWRNFSGTITVHERDAGARRVVMTNRASDAKGRYVGEARIEIGLAELGVHTNVSIYSRVRMPDGVLAEKTIRDASARQMAEFAANLEAMLTA
jgi:carbon monoxide dehydrogenase subunit G